MNSHFYLALSEKSFLFLWLGQIFTQISINLFYFFLILVVYTLTGSTIAVSGVVLSYTVPAILFGVLAGVYVDKWSKRKVLYAANIFRAFLFLLLIFFHTNLTAIYIITFLISIATQFFIPAESPVIPLVVKKKNLYSANAIFGITLYGSILAAYILSGPVLLHFGPVRTLIFLSGMMLVGAYFIFLIKYINKISTQKKKISYSFLMLVSDIKKTFGVITSQKIVRRSVFLLSLSQILILVVSVLAPSYATQVLQIKVEDFPLVFVAPAAFGVIVGAVVIINFFYNFSKEKMSTIGLFLSGISLLLLPGIPKISSQSFFQTTFISIESTYLILFVAFILGISNALVFVPSNTLLLETTSVGFRGKMYGVMNTIVGIFSLIPILVVGGLSDILGVGRVLIGIAIVILILGFSRLFID